MSGRKRQSKVGQKNSEVTSDRQTKPKQNKKSAQNRKTDVKHPQDGQKNSEVTSDPQAKPKQNENSAQNQKTDVKHQKELAERDVFAGDEKSYENLSASQRPFTQPSPVKVKKQDFAQTAMQSVSAGGSRLMSRLKSLSTMQKCLLGAITVISVMLIFALLQWSSKPEAYPSVQLQSKHPYARTTPEANLKVPQQQIQGISENQPISLQLARELYLNKDFQKACSVYQQLLQNLSGEDASNLMRDYLKLKIALTKITAQQQQAFNNHSATPPETDEAHALLRAVANSSSPAVRVLANYYLADIALERKQFLKARARAYRTLALLDLIDQDNEWARKIRNDCLFFVPESLTRKVLSLSDADKDIPQDLWKSRTEGIDPFEGLNETELRSFLKKGLKELKTELLGPKITRIGESSKSPLHSAWSAISYRASVEELLARFASNARLDLSWKITGESQSKAAVRKRPVTLFMEQASVGHLVSTALGRTGLLGEVKEDKLISVYNPDDYISLSDHISLLSRKAISLWRSFMLIVHEDSRVPNAHFAVALLQNIKSNHYDAIAQCKLLANRYHESSLTPFALLYSSSIKTELHDYTGAREDLEQLIQQYPECELSEQACLNLADIHMKAGLNGQAVSLYQKVYNLGASRSSQLRAALGAGKCFYIGKRYEAAQKWLNRYIKLTIESPDDNLYTAYFLLGKTYLALEKAEPAAEALKLALEGNPSREECGKIISTLIDALSREQKYVEALDVLEKVKSRPFSRVAAMQMLVLRVKLLRKMGLVERAVSILGSRIEYVTNPDLKARISFELAKCHVAKADLDSAQSLLSKAVTIAESQSLAHKIGLTLADVCLRLGQPKQTISICQQILNAKPSKSIKKQTLNKLAEAYNSEKDYNRAALTLMGHWQQQEPRDLDQSLEEPIAKDSLSQKQE